MSIEVRSDAIYVVAAAERTDLAPESLLSCIRLYFLINLSALLLASISIGSVTSANTAVKEKSTKPISASPSRFRINPAIINIYPNCDPILTIGTSPVLMLKSRDFSNFC